MSNTEREEATALNESTRLTEGSGAPKIELWSTASNLGSAYESHAHDAPQERSLLGHPQMKDSPFQRFYYLQGITIDAGLS